MTKKNIDTIKFVKKIVKEKERDDKEWHPTGDTDLHVRKLLSKVGVKLR